MTDAEKRAIRACAEAADKICGEVFDIYKGRAPETERLRRADTYCDGYSDGAGAVGVAIRELYPEAFEGEKA